MKVKLTFTLLLLFLQTMLPQENDWNRFWDTGADLLSAPSSFDGGDWALAGGFTALTLGASFADDPLRDFVKRNQTTALDALFSVDTYSVEAQLLGALGVYLYGAAIDNDKTRQVGLDLGEALFYSNAVVLGMKIMIGRRRPVAAQHSREFKPFDFSWEYRSFPSGHAANAWAFSTVLAEDTSSHLVKTFWYTLASMISLARVYNGVHWLSDVIAGSALGFFIGRLCVTDLTEQDPLTPVVPAQQIQFSIPF